MEPVWIQSTLSGSKFLNRSFCLDIDSIFLGGEVDLLLFLDFLLPGLCEGVERAVLSGVTDLVEPFERPLIMNFRLSSGVKASKSGSWC